MISQAVTILCFWIFLYPTEAMKIKSTKRSLCDIQPSLWLFSMLILLINPCFEVSIWPSQMLPRQSSSRLGKCHFFLCRFPLSQHTNFSLYFPYPVPLLLPPPYCSSLTHDCHSCSHLPSATPCKPDDRVTQNSQADTRYLQSKCSAPEKIPVMTVPVNI